MLESIFITMFIVGFLSFVLAIDKKALAYSGASFIIFIVLMAQSVFVEVPFLAATNATNYTTGNQQHMELSVVAICLFFVIMNVIFMLLRLVAWRKSKNEIAMP